MMSNAFIRAPPYTHSTPPHAAICSLAHMRAPHTLFGPSLIPLLLNLYAILACIPILAILQNIAHHIIDVGIADHCQIIHAYLLHEGGKALPMLFFLYRRIGRILLRGMNNDIYFQIALLTIVGLSAKNSILIVEFARALHEEGKDLLIATVEASRLRLRPIIMTSLCFILGVIPLAISNGAGSGAQNALGTAVMAGMVTATGLGVYYTPLFFVLVTRFFSRKKAS